MLNASWVPLVTSFDLERLLQRIEKLEEQLSNLEHRVEQFCVDVAVRLEDVERSMDES